MNRTRRRMAEYEPGSPTWQAMLDRRNALADLRQSLEDQLGPITTLSTDPGEVIDPAGIPSSPSSPRPLVFGAAGACSDSCSGSASRTPGPAGERTPGAGPVTDG